MKNISHNRPRISVLMSAYNAEKYMKEAIESILNQSFTDFEFIIIDDASTDKTLEIIKSFKDTRIVILSNKNNLGLTKSLNIGLRKSRGEYIARLDADDIALPRRLEKQYRFMENNPNIVLVGGKMEIIDEDGKLKTIKKASIDPIRIKFEIIFRNPLFHSTIFFRKKTIENIGGYDETAKNVEDYDLYSKLIKEYKISNLDDILIKFRCHNNSITTTSNSQKIMYENALKIIHANINNYTALTIEEFNQIKNILVVKGDDKKKKLKTLIKANKLVNKIFKSFIVKEKLTTKEIAIIKPYYNELRKMLFKRYLINFKKNIQQKFKKITPHNIFIKWPKIILWKIKEKIYKSPLKMFLFANNPIILKDYQGINFILYPWNKHPLKKLLTKSNCKTEFKALEKLVKNNNIVFDLGANIGIHTTILSRLASTNGKVYSFEPVSDTYWELKKTIALNKLDNTKAYKLAIGKEIGTKTINIFDQNNSEWNSFGKPNFNNILPTDSEEVKITTLDNFYATNNITNIDFLKIDVEGFEKDVLIGAKNLLENKKIKYLSFEISQIPLKGASMNSKDIFDILKSYGYLSFKFNGESEKFEGPFNDSNEFHENYYASYNDLTKI